MNGKEFYLKGSDDGVFSFYDSLHCNVDESASKFLIVLWSSTKNLYISPSYEVRV